MLQRSADSGDRVEQLGEGDADAGDAIVADADQLRLENAIERRDRFDSHQPWKETPSCGMPSPGLVWAPWRALRLSAAMRSFSLMIESSKASGVGGQPGTYTSTGTTLSTPWISA